MDIFLTKVGQREFVTIPGLMSIPLDRIKYVDFNPPNGGSDNNARIVTDDPDEDWIFAYDNADVVKEFFTKG